MCVRVHRCTSVYCIRTKVILNHKWTSVGCVRVHIDIITSALDNSTGNLFRVPIDVVISTLDISML